MKVLHLAQVWVAFAVAACVSPPTATGPETGPEFAAAADELIGRTKTACEFIPSVTAITALLSGGATAPIATIANGICAEVAKLPQREADEGPVDATVIFNGITVRGTLL
jgi:hypothetical protein